MVTAGGLRVTFVMERHLGHDTYYWNLRRVVDRSSDVRAQWIDVAYEPAARWWERMPGLSNEIRGALRGRREVRLDHAQAADVTFFNTQVPAVLGGRRSRRQPYVLATDITPAQYDDMADAYGHTPDREGVTARLKHSLSKQVFQQAHRACAWSHWAADSLVRDYGVDPDSVAVVPPGVDTTRWSPVARSSRGPLKVLFVGGDFHRKGGRDLLAAVAQLPRGTCEVTVVTRSRVDRADHVRVLTDAQPNSPELIDEFRAHDVFAMPSRAEAFGIAAVEAAATGLPVVATRVGGLPDIVEDGRTGFLVQPGDVGALRDRLERLMSPDLRIAMGHAARRHAERHFDAERNAGRILHYLRQASGGRAPGPGAEEGPGAGAGDDGGPHAPAVASAALQQGYAP